MTFVGGLLTHPDLNIHDVPDKNKSTEKFNSPRTLPDVKYKFSKRIQNKHKSFLHWLRPNISTLSTFWNFPPWPAEGSTLPLQVHHVDSESLIWGGGGSTLRPAVHKYHGYPVDWDIILEHYHQCTGFHRHNLVRTHQLPVAFHPGSMSSPLFLLGTMILQDCVCFT